LATALKDRYKSVEQDSKVHYADSNFLGHSSMSFKSIIATLCNSFIGYIDDPDENDYKTNDYKSIKNNIY
jgi:hypothetical protein